MGDAPPRSPLAPAAFPDLPEIGGAAFAAAAAGVRKAGRPDVMLARLAPGSAVAGVFTRSSTRSAAVLDCEAKIGADGAGEGAAILVNSGNANAFTGRDGAESVTALAAATAAALNLPESRVFTSSTGVIGEPLPRNRILDSISGLAEGLRPDGLADAARAIMTTDTYPKASCATADIDGGQVRIAGIAKGSGMIAPDMATMLAYVFTDAEIERADLQSAVSELNDATFNRITVDGDTSTSDTLIAAATGASGVRVDSRTAAFREALGSVMLDLAHQIVRDGEGASKFVEVAVSGATSDADARRHAMAVANSPLVKTAIAGEDPNWGRVVMAIGKSDAPADRDRLTIRFGDVTVARDGWRDPDYCEEDAARQMKGREIAIAIDLGLGGGCATVWTCDLTHGYVSINADYRS